CLLFFFQAEDGIRDFHVTGVQTCALPISLSITAVLWWLPRLLLAIWVLLPAQEVPERRGATGGGPVFDRSARDAAVVPSARKPLPRTGAPAGSRGVGDTPLDTSRGAAGTAPPRVTVEGRAGPATRGTAPRRPSAGNSSAADAGPPAAGGRGGCGGRACAPSGARSAP